MCRWGHAPDGTGPCVLCGAGAATAREHGEGTRLKGVALLPLLIPQAGKMRGWREAAVRVSEFGGRGLVEKCADTGVTLAAADRTGCVVLRSNAGFLTKTPLS